MAFDHRLNRFLKEGPERDETGVCKNTGIVHEPVLGKQEDPETRKTIEVYYYRFNDNEGNTVQRWTNAFSTEIILTENIS